MLIQRDSESGGEYPADLYGSGTLASYVPDLATIGDVDIAWYREQGYLAVESAVSPERVSDALAGLSAVLHDPRGAQIQLEHSADDGPPTLDTVRKFMGFAGSDSRLHALAYDESILATVRRLLGAPDVVMMQDMALLKPPGGGREKPWHQDKAFFNLATDTPIVGVWIALDPARLDNGCMHIKPGSHRAGPVVHFRRRDWQICDSHVDRANEVTVPLAPGGALFFDGLIQHGTPENGTNTRRRALQFHYRTAVATEISEAQRMAVFGSEGKNVTC